MKFRSIAIAAIAACCSLAGLSPALAQSDLLVAPTRLVLAGNTGGEVVLSNKGDSRATYRISLVLRRMDADGRITAVDEEFATPEEAAALDILTYAPRRITLASQESRTVRVGVRAPDTMPAGEYRAHLLFRSVPDAADPVSAEDAGEADGVSIRLTPVYGVAIPVIVRVGEVNGEASITIAQMGESENGPTVNVELSRSGNRSVYGDLAIMRAGEKEPVTRIKGIALYPEIDNRRIAIPVDRSIASASGLSVQFTESDPAGDGQPVVAPLGR